MRFGRVRRAIDLVDSDEDARKGKNIVINEELSRDSSKRCNPQGNTYVEIKSSTHALASSS